MFADLVPAWREAEIVDKFCTMVKSKLDTLYGAFQKAENRVGGGEGLVGIYGSMTQQGTCSIMGAMAQHAGLGPDSILVDIGSGLCRPLLHACMEYGVKHTYGVELDAVKCQKAIPFIKHTVRLLAMVDIQLPENCLPTVICSSVEQLGSLEPATHAYAAWEGFPETAKQAVGRLFVASPSLQAITIVQRSLRKQDPAEVMEELGFGKVECCAAALAAYMAGSGRKLNAYLFKKTASSTQQRRQTPGEPSLLTAKPFQPDQVLAELENMRRSSSPTSKCDTCPAAHHAHGLRSRGSSFKHGESSAAHSKGDDDVPQTPSPIRSLARATAKLVAQDDTCRQDQGDIQTDAAAPARKAPLAVAPIPAPELCALRERKKAAGSKQCTTTEAGSKNVRPTRTKAAASNV